MPSATFFPRAFRSPSKKIRSSPSLHIPPPASSQLPQLHPLSRPQTARKYQNSPDDRNWAHPGTRLRSRPWREQTFLRPPVCAYLSEMPRLISRFVEVGPWDCRIGSVTVYFLLASPGGRGISAACRPRVCYPCATRDESGRAGDDVVGPALWLHRSAGCLCGISLSISTLAPQAPRMSEFVGF